MRNVAQSASSKTHPVTGQLISGVCLNILSKLTARVSSAPDMDIGAE